MKIVIAPDSFKGSLSSAEVCRAMGAGVREVMGEEVEISLVPMADGGEGTVQAVVAATGGKLLEVLVKDPLGRPVTAVIGLTGGGSTAVLEMAAASGLPLLKEGERNPLRTSTFGTGQLIKAALDLEVKRIILGIGGSATNDGGMGMAHALGAIFRDAGGRELKDGGEFLGQLDSIDLSGLDPRLQTTEILVACDVNNPLTGPKGASVVYGPQKGATPEMVKMLDAGLLNLARVVEKSLGISINELPGAGAAGGLGGGAVAFLKAKMKPGVELVMDVTGFREKLKDSFLVITGEGRIDAQSVFGKTITGIAKAARKLKIPVLAVGGSLGEDYQKLYLTGIAGIIAAVSRPMTMEEAIADAPDLIKDATARGLRLFLAGKGIFSWIIR